MAKKKSKKPKYPVCQKCGSDRIRQYQSEDCNSGMHNFCYKGAYLQTIDTGLDYEKFDLCMECGQIQGKWPKNKSTFEEFQDKYETNEDFGMTIDEFDDYIDEDDYEK